MAVAPGRTPAAKITLEVDASLASQARATLAALGVAQAQAHTRRVAVLRETRLLPFLPPTTRLDEDPAEVFEVWLPRAQAPAALLACVRALDLITPGRGAAYAEEVQLLQPLGMALHNPLLSVNTPPAGRGEVLSPRVLMNCVVQRGRGSQLARSAIAMGTCVPSINFGDGRGVRDRLGLLRIAIPAEKEIVSVLVEPQDRDLTFEALINAGRLRQPGRGFIAAYPVLLGIGNPRSVRGQGRHGASMDQVIAAIDALRAGTDWRRRTGVTGVTGGPAPATPTALADLVNVALSCNEGSADAVLATALAAGAEGATISRVRQFSPTGQALPCLPGREVVDLSLPEGRLDRLLQALAGSSAFDVGAACVIETKALAAACTYIAPG